MPARVVLGEADSELAFFTEIMGDHQRLDNGNILIVSTGQGRLLEFSEDGRLAWRMDNRVGDVNLAIMQATVLPKNQDQSFFLSLTKNCGVNN